MAKVLIVEDDEVIAQGMARHLSAAGFDPLWVGKGEAGLARLRFERPDVCVLDLMLPGLDGWKLIETARAEGIGTPIVVVSARGTEHDRIHALEIGADDYVVKPFSYNELRARVAALLRRTQRRPGMGRLRVGTLEVDPPSREVRARGDQVELSQKEFALLRTLAAEPTRVWTKEELLRSIWGFRSMGATRTLDSHACRLRAKLGRHGDRYVVNVWGVGYRLVDGPVAA